MSRPLIRQLDTKLFEPTKWFLIDEKQNKLADVVSLDRGLALIARGNAAAVVGRLSPGVAVIDVDAGDIVGDAITDNLISWLARRSRWHLVRPSGGGRGRNHVYCVPGTDAADLAAFITHLRASYGLPAVKIDHRGAAGASPWLRPLSSPHRLTGLTPAPLASPIELHDALRDLTRVLQRRSADKTTARARKATKAAGRQVVALEPLPRPRRDLEPRWAAWIEGRAPAPLIGGGDLSRSAIELAATTALLRTGLRSADAWDVIRHSNATVFAKARTRGHRWWIRQQWNPAVRSDTEWRRANPGDATSASRGPASLDNQRAIAAARADLSRLQWAWGHRERHSVLLVAHTLLDRMLRDDTLAVPCPLRNLEEDTGLARNTILGAFAALVGHLGRRIAAFDHTRAESSSHLFELADCYSAGGVSLSEPPGVTPTHRHTPGRWAVVTPTAHTLWRSLSTAGAGVVVLEDLARSSGLTHSPEAAPTQRQLRTVRTRLCELQAFGLARVDAGGRWYADDRGTSGGDRAAAAIYGELHARISRERESYRSGAWNRWNRGRLRALARNRVRQRTWWDALPELERSDRRHSLSRQYGVLSQSEQGRRRERMAAARYRAGERSERERHVAWCRGFDPAAQADRSAQWQQRFLTLTPSERAERERMLDVHRRRWHLPRTWSTSASTSLALEAP